MKKHFTTVIMLFALFFSVSAIEAQTSQQQVQVEPDMTVIASPEVYQLSKEWAKEYNANNPGNEITVIRQGSSNISEDKLMGVITSEKFTDGNDQWKVTLCRQLLVPVIHADNPYINTLRETGISREALAEMFTSDNPEWAIEDKEKSRAQLLLPTDEMMRQQIASFMGTDLSKQKYRSYDNPEDMIAALQQDKKSVAFLPLKAIVDESNNTLTDNVAFLPIDRNNNGHLEYMEDIYGSVSSFSRGVWIGKYPKALCCNVYFASSAKPEKSREKSFISFLLTKGQNDLARHGYSNLAYTERQAELQQLQGLTSVSVEEQDSSSSWATILLILAGIVIVTGLLANLAFGFTRAAETAESTTEAEESEGYALDEQTVAAPAGLYFDKSHTWSFLEKDGKVRMGIDDFLQQVTGPITRIKMKNNGDYVKKGEPVVTLIQNGKQITIKAPVSGSIHSINSSLEKDAGMINTSPYNQGWLYLITPDNWQQEIPFLKMAADYKEWLKQEFIRLKDFLAFSLKVNKDAYANVVLQDGGSIKKHVLKDLNPEAWEDFQEKFIENVK